jgi:hypothetical protein
MAALTASRATVRSGDTTLIEVLSVPLGANKKVYSGGLVVLVAATGLGQAGDGSANSLRVVGVALYDTGATSGQAAGAVRAEVRRGAFWLNNSATDPLAQADCMAICYIEDDNTVCKTAGSLSTAGVVLEIGSGDYLGQVLVQISGAVLP